MVPNISIMKTADVRANLLHVVNSVHYKQEEVIIMKGKRPMAKIVPLTDADLQFIDELQAS